MPAGRLRSATAGQHGVAAGRGRGRGVAGCAAGRPGRRLRRAGPLPGCGRTPARPVRLDGHPAAFVLHQVPCGGHGGVLVLGPGPGQLGDAVAVEQGRAATGVRPAAVGVTGEELLHDGRGTGGVDARQRWHAARRPGLGVSRDRVVVGAREKPYGHLLVEDERIRWAVTAAVVATGLPGGGAAARPPARGAHGNRGVPACRSGPSPPVRSAS